ncbi:MAG: type II secretion system GspH family protein [Rhodospirillaceae bacterium]|nr:type II secretion system GspH family protein [Rhodospirillaceae bacterium]
MYRAKSGGFTLIEMAIVLVVMGLAVSGIVTVGASIGTSAKYGETQRIMAKVQDALRVYVTQHGCLPCPALGSEDPTASGTLAGLSRDTVGSYVTATTFCTSNTCLTNNGVVPYKTLGIGPQEYLDAWDSMFTYRIGAGLAADNAMVRTPPSTFPAGDITVVNARSTAILVTTEAAYVLVSHGGDGAFAFRQTGSQRPDVYGQTGSAGGQDENRDGDATFAQGDEDALATVAHFDDLVVFETAPLMIFRCGSGACGNPS